MSKKLDSAILHQSTMFPAGHNEKTLNQNKLPGVELVALNHPDLGCGVEVIFKGKTTFIPSTNFMAIYYPKDEVKPKATK